MDGKCFSYNPIPAEKFCLDSALDELGMLSTRTKCGLELEETPMKAETNQKFSSYLPSSVPRYFVQMDPKFVTHFSVRNSLADFELEELSDEPYGKSTVYHKLKDTVAKRQKRLYRPYCEKPSCGRLWHTVTGVRMWPKSASRELPMASSSESPSEKPSSSSLLVPLQDSGRKSNPSSPVKSQSSLTSVGCSIFRSRSLDDLEISKLSLKDDLMCHGEIDTVSQCISKLHVS